jgi:tetratricopeptide (TPR) repeat protein
LEELRQFGSFEQLPTKVAEYLTAITPEELFRLVLHRWQQDFDADRDLVRHALCLLWAARQGLSETEWRELLGTPGEPLLRQIWSPLFLAMEPHLALRAGLHAFGHDYLRAAVRKQWLEGAETVGAFHMQLAAYFAKIAEPTGRKLNEQAWQLRRALEAPADMSRRQTAWQSLWETLTDASWARAVINSGAAAELVDDYVALHEASDSNLSKDRVGQALEALMRDAQGKVGVPPLSVANVNAWIVYRPDKALLELLFAHVLAEEPPANDAAARRFYAACAIRSGGMRRRDAQFDTAEQLFAKVRAIFDGDGGADDSEQSTLEYEIGYVHFLRGNFDAAIHHFHLSSEHARKAGNSVGEWISRCLEGNVRFMSGRNTGDEFKRVLDEANRTFTDAASVNPDALRWVMNVKGHHFDVAVLSNNALEAGKWNRALQDDRWISLFESKWDVVRSGRLALVQGRFADAVADLQSYLSKLGDGAARAEQAARVYLELGRALDGDGKREAAVEKWNDGLRICRDDCGNRLWKAQIQNELSAV